MATYFVDSVSGSAANNGTSWAAAYDLLKTAIAGAGGSPALAAGDTIFVGDDHNGSEGAVATTLTFPGTVANPVFIYCADHTVTTPGTGNLKTTGIVFLTGANLILSLGGSFYVYGLTLGGGNSGNTGVTLVSSGGTDQYQYYDACALKITGTGVLRSNSANRNRVILNNTTVSFSGTGSFIALQAGAEFIWQNTPSAILGATLPTTLVNTSSSSVFRMTFRGVDLSALGSGKTLVGSAGPQTFIVMFEYCKLGASVTVAATPLGPACEIHLIDCDSGGTNYRSEKYLYWGTQTTETTIVRTGGASDGTTPISWKLVSTANAKWVQPFDSIRINMWNDTTGSRTATIYGTTTGGGVPNSDDVWIEVEYLGDAASPQGSFITSSKANNLAASAAGNNSSDGSTWGGGGAGNGFKMVTPSFTVNQKGYVSVTIKVAKASSTYYIDPLIVLA